MKSKANVRLSRTNSRSTRLAIAIIFMIVVPPLLERLVRCL